MLRGFLRMPNLPRWKSHPSASSHSKESWSTSLSKEFINADEPCCTNAGRYTTHDWSLCGQRNYLSRMLYEAEFENVSLWCLRFVSSIWFESPLSHLLLLASMECTETTAWVVEWNLGNIIAALVIYGWQLMRSHTIAINVGFVAWVEPITFSTAMTVACV